eukprot:GDKJ01014310.1.p1 GENE.GDKJ01014310.1~~GDKJ01014310.1.p1  ORF type:complete len:574 (-),score=112.39 GDKJ01014310.1:391-2112(-)
MEPLSDPKKDRVVQEVRPPPHKPLTNALLYPSGTDIPDWKQLKNHLAREGRLTKEQVLKLIKCTKAITSQEPNMLPIADPVTVVGDIHGQYYDLCRLLEFGNGPEKTQHLFLGDYVDRGSFSIECLLLIMALKLNFPKSIWMLRGNHECRQMTSFFNFRDECEYKLDESVYQQFMEFFDTLPLAAVINGKFLAVHGGLSPDLQTISQLNTIQRFREPPRSGLFCDLLWSDPVDEEKPELVARAKTEKFLSNDVRGCSYFFGYEAAASFLKKNGLLSVVRAHEAQLQGYKMHQTNPRNGFPTVLTIFSAPNYCDCYNNTGAVLKFSGNTMNIQQFNYSQHPYHLPNFMDVFTWSVPFVSEKIAEMLGAILASVADQNYNDDDLDAFELPVEIERQIAHFINIDALKPDDSKLKGVPLVPASASNPSVLSRESATAKELTVKEVKDENPLPSRADLLRKKVQTVARMTRMFKTLRQQNELVVQLKGLSPGHRIPVGVLLQGRTGIQTEIDRFQTLKTADEKNEAMPSEAQLIEYESSHHQPANECTFTKPLMPQPSLSPGTKMGKMNALNSSRQK